MNAAVPAPVQALARSPELDAFCGVQERFLYSGEGVDPLSAHAAVLVAEACRRYLPPQHIFFAVRITRVRMIPDSQSGALWRVELLRKATTGGIRSSASRVERCGVSISRAIRSSPGKSRQDSRVTYPIRGLPFEVRIPHCHHLRVP